MKYHPSFSIETWIHNQVKMWETMKEKTVAKTEPKPFITISREYGCNANSLARDLEKALNELQNNEQWHSYDKDLLTEIHKNHDVHQKLIETLDTKKREELNEVMMNMLAGLPSQAGAYKKLMHTIRALALQGKKLS